MLGDVHHEGESHDRDTARAARLRYPAERGRLAARRYGGGAGRALVVAALCGACLWGPSAAHASTHTADAGGVVWAWGDNAGGELGTGRTANSRVPVAVRGLSGVIAISAGDESSVALRRDGTVWAWGDVSSGEAGTGTTADHALLPVAVRGLSGVTAIASSLEFDLAIAR